MARYLNLIHGLKVAVVAPNETLAASQQSMYCPWSSKNIDDLYGEGNHISHCIPSDLLVRKIPPKTVMIYDEVDSLFFSDKPVIFGNVLTSAVLFMNKYRCIGMSATFRGERGANVMNVCLQKSIFT
jgi:hypothetical protein